MSLSKVPSSEYTDDYYKNACQGFDEYSSSLGKELPPRLSIPLNLANLQPNLNVLDIGCGRGELLIHVLLKGSKVYGVDYAVSSMRIAKDTLNNSLKNPESESVHLQQSDARYLPFASETMDIIFMLDVVEHLYPAELKQAFTEVARVLKPGGKLIIHTMPNLWYYNLGYPLFRVFKRLSGEILPKNPRDRFPYNHLHVNEQTPLRLKKYLENTKLTSKVWMKTTQDYSYEKNKVVVWFMKLLVNVYPIKYIFCNDIFAIATKSRH